MAFRGYVGLVGRESECAVLDQTIAAVRTGESRVLVVHGAPGVGKSALLEHLESSATGMLVLRAVGVESEMELAFATLHQLCVPLLDQLADLPAPQRDALETVFGMRAGAPPERFLVGLAVLSLLSDASEERPVLCVVDDAQWMDRASAQVLGFVAGRLLAESVALVFAARQRMRDLRGLPELEVTGLGTAEAHALLELPRELTVTQLAGGFGLPHTDKLPQRIEQSFLTRIEELPEQSRLLLLTAAAEPVGARPPARAVGRVTGGQGRGPPGGASGVGGGHRPPGRAGPPCLAPGVGRRRTRRDRRRGARALRRPCAGTRWSGRCWPVASSRPPCSRCGR